MAAATGNEQPIIIKKKKRKGSHDGHHSSAWKVAYADFVTAMMAFFLLLWLLSVTTDDQRRGIADYFDPGAVSEQSSGSGGVLGGLTIGQPGQLSSPSSRFSQHRSLPGTPYPAEDSHTLDEHDGDEPGEEVSTEYRFDGDTTIEELRRTLSEDELAEALAQWEEQQFREASEQLRQAIQSVPQLEQLADNLIVERAPEGLRIQIVDQERVSMFPMGSADMYGRTEQLLEQVAQAIGQMPNHISISGHTDATPYASGRTYDNWDLSVDRANASRRALVESGIDPSRIATVIGLADTDLMFPQDPTSPRNRRISIVLLREAPDLAGQTEETADSEGPLAN
jgi:chemotaxis protein MotB